MLPLFGDPFLNIFLSSMIRFADGLEMAIPFVLALILEKGLGTIIGCLGIAYIYLDQHVLRS